MVAEHIHIEDINNQAHGYFVLQGIVNVDIDILDGLPVSALTQLDDGHGTQATEKKYDKVRSDMIPKAIEG